MLGMTNNPSNVVVYIPNVTLTADEYVAVNYRLWRSRPRTYFNHWLLAAAVGLLAVSVGLDVARTGGISNASSAVLLAVALFYALVRMQLVRYQLRRGYAQNVAVHTPIHFELDADGLRGASELGRFEARWRTVRRAVLVRPHWLLLYPVASACYYVDLRRVQAPATVAEVLALLREHSIPMPEV